MEGELPVSQECIRSANESSGATSPSHSSQSNLLGSGNLVCAANGHGALASGSGCSASASSGAASASACSGSASSGVCTGAGTGAGVGAAPGAGSGATVSTSASTASSTSGTFLIWIHNVSPQQRYTVVRTSKSSNVAQVIEQVLAKGRQSENPANCQLVVETMASSAIQSFAPTGSSLGNSQSQSQSLRPQSRDNEVISAPTSRRPTNEASGLANACANLSSSTEKMTDASRANEAVYFVDSVLKRDEIVFLVLKNLPPGSRFALRRSLQFAHSPPDAGAAAAAGAGSGTSTFEDDTLVMPEIRQQRSMSSPETPNRRPSKLCKQKAKHSEKEQDDAQSTFAKTQTSQTSQTSQFSQNSAFTPDHAPPELQGGVFGTTDSARSADETTIGVGAGAMSSARPLSPPPLLHYLLEPDLLSSSRSCGRRDCSQSGSASVRDRSHTAAERSPSPKASPQGSQRPHSCSGISSSELLLASPAADSPPPPLSTPSSLAAPSFASAYRAARGGGGVSTGSQGPPPAVGMQRGESKKGKGIGSGLKHLLFKKDQN